MTRWEQWIKRRSDNIGFITRAGGFKPPTEAEIAAAKAIEINAWQRTKGEIPYHVSASYALPKGHGINLLRTREPGGKLDGPEYTKSVESYILTPIDHHGILKAHGIDVSRYERPPNIFMRIIDWFKKKKDPDYERGPRLTAEFIDSMTSKEKK
jgi:hypothetical protein